MTITEGHLEFNFDASWQTVKYDEHAQHVERLQKIDSQAIDILGSRNDLVLLLEIKDFRGHRIENKEKLGGSLAKTIAQKMRDSVGGIIGQRRLDAAAASLPWSRCCESLASGRAVLAVLFLQTTRNPPERRKSLMSIELKLLKQTMRWSGMQVLVVDLDSYAPAIPNLTVRSLPGAGIA
ncbi:MAG TPA: hypothetical protein VFE47_09760 [Tepidisphaeraceae bacterium]|nr:hypothetical protein [Tepidisphaeraceae bacterium]